jgi:uncharacterized protein YkuJ
MFFLKLIETNFQFHLKHKIYKLLVEVFKEGFESLDDFDVLDHVFTANLTEAEKLDLEEDFQSQVGNDVPNQKEELKKIIMGGDYFSFSWKNLAWERTNNEVKDFCTLIRQMINILLGFQGIISREFVSSNGLLIVNVCFAHDFNTFMVTEYLRMKQFLDFNTVDLLSMEPIDSKYRPLRLNLYLNKAEKWTEQYNPKGDNSEVEQLRVDILTLINRIDFPKILRDSKSLPDIDIIKPENCARQIYQHSIEKVSVWQEYHQYLVNLDKKVKQIRKSSFIEKQQIKMKYLRKFKGQCDLGVVLKTLLMKTSPDDSNLKERIQIGLNKLKKSAEHDGQSIQMLQGFLDSYSEKKHSPAKLFDKRTQMPIKSVEVIKDNSNWLDKKNREHTKQLSSEYYESFKDSFEGCSVLVNKWLIWKQFPIGGHKEFHFPGNKRKKRVKNFMINMWRNYRIGSEVNSILDEFEKLRSVDFQLNKMIQMGELGFYYESLLDSLCSKDLKKHAQVKLVVKAIGDICFPLHNYFRFHGNTELFPIFDSLVEEVGSIKVKIVGDKQYLVPKPKQPAHSAHLNDSVYLKERKKTIKHLVDNFKEKPDSVLSGKYKLLEVKKKFWPLSKVFTLSKFLGLKFSSKFPFYTLRNYYGPKIAIYYYFLGFFINRLVIIGVVGLLIFLIRITTEIFLESIAETDPNSAVNTISLNLNYLIHITLDFMVWLFCLYLFLWSVRFERDWKTHQKIFQINNGDTEENEGNMKDEDRITIKEYHYTRSIVTDEMNKKTNKPFVEKFRITMSFIFVLLLGLLSIGLSICNIEFKNYMSQVFHLNFHFDVDQIPASMLEIIKIQVLDYLFQFIVIKLAQWIDPVTKAEFEKIIVVFNLMFICFNHFSIIPVFRLYTPFRFGECHGRIPNNDKTYEFLKQNNSTYKSTGSLTSNNANFIDNQLKALRCVNDIKLFYVFYIIMNFILVVIRYFYLKLRISRLRSHHDTLSEDIKECTLEKLRIWKEKVNREFLINQSENQNTLSKKHDMVDEAVSDINADAFKTGQGLEQLNTEEFENIPQKEEEEEQTKKSKKDEDDKNEETVKVFKHDVFKNYYKLNHYIEREIYLEEPGNLNDLDPSIQDFNQVFTKFIALVFFGYLFEASFIFYYFALLMELSIDRQEMIFIKRRNSPQEINSIGYFKYFIEICPKISLLIICYYLVFYYTRITLEINILYFFFVLIFGIGFLLEQLVFAIPPKGSMRIRHLIQRQKFIGKFLIPRRQTEHLQQLRQDKSGCRLQARKQHCQSRRPPHHQQRRRRLLGITKGLRSKTSFH